MGAKIAPILLLALISCCKADNVRTPQVAEPLTVPQYEQKIFDRIFDGYNSEIRPSNTTNVKFGIALNSASINEAESRFEGTAFLRFSWEDPRLVWDESEYGGVKVLRLEPSNVWLPDIALYNSAEPSKGNRGMDCGQTKVLIYSKGEVLWVPPCTLKALCGPTTEVQTQQICSLKFGSWVYDGFTFNLSIYNNETKLDLADFIDVSDWSVLSGIAVRNENYYPCCPEPYYDISYNITMKRK